MIMMFRRCDVLLNPIIIGCLAIHVHVLYGVNFFPFKIYSYVSFIFEINSFNRIKSYKVFYSLNNYNRITSRVSLTRYN